MRNRHNHPLSPLRSASEPPTARLSAGLQLSRRRFLAGAGAAGLTLWLPKSASGDHGGDHWGSLREGVWESRERDYKILEVFLTGGLSPWETFYVDRPGTNTSTIEEVGSWRGSFGFADGLVPQEFPGFIKPLPGGEFSRPFPNNQSEVHFSYATSPLWDTPIWERTRVVVVRHNQSPHEGAIPLSLTGLRLGNPRMAGLGAPIDRHVRAGGGALAADRAFPAAYFLEPYPRANGEELENAISVGRHGASYRPVHVPLHAADGLRAALKRGNVGGGGEGIYSALLDAHRETFAAALSHGDVRLRSRSLDSYHSAREALRIAPTLETIIGGRLEPGFEGDKLGRALDTALDLLNQGEIQSAGYVGVAADDRFDGHFDNAERSVPTLQNILTLLKDRIAPGPPAEPTLNLDDTLVVLTSEFGRTPIWQSGSNTRNHHPEGSLSILIGGPIQPGNHGYAGAMNVQGYAAEDDSFGPADVRAAVLMAAGIDPLQTPDVFSLSDLSSRVGENGEADVLRGLRASILGVSEG